MAQIGIVGAGFVGEALAGQLVRTGHHVKVANSRGRDSLKAFAQNTGAEAVDISEISSNLDVLFIAVPMSRIKDLPKAIFQSLPPSAVVVDAGNYYPLRDGAIAAIDEGMVESQWVSQQLGVAVVKAFNNIIASRLTTSGRPQKDRNRIALPVSGDDSKARAGILAIVEQLGFNGYDAGPLSDSWRQQPGQPAYCTDPTSEELPMLLRRAERKKAPEGRDRAFKLLGKLPENYPAEELVRVSRIFVGLDKWKPQAWLAVLRLVFALVRSRR